MITILYLLSALLASTYCQFAVDGMRPDISFTGDNDRYDISGMLQNNRHFRQRLEEYRRHKHKHKHKSRREGAEDDIDEEKLKMYEKDFNDLLIALEKTRRDGMENDGQFAYHDQMDSGDAGRMTDFENNLKKFQRARPNDEEFRRAQKYVGFLHGGKTRRSAGDPEQEILMHHAVPVEMKVKGFLQAPLK